MIVNYDTRFVNYDQGLTLIDLNHVSTASDKTIKANAQKGFKTF